VISCHFPTFRKIPWVSFQVYEADGRGFDIYSSVLKLGDAAAGNCWSLYTNKKATFMGKMMEK